MTQPMDSCAQPSRDTRDWDGASQPGAFPRLTDTQFCGRIVETLQVVIHFRRDKFRASSSSLKVDGLLKRDPVAFSIHWLHMAGNTKWLPDVDVYANGSHAANLVNFV